MKERDLSISQLAVRADMSLKSLYQFKNNKSLPSMTTLEQIAQALGPAGRGGSRDTDMGELIRLRYLHPITKRLRERISKANKRDRPRQIIICEFCHKPGVAVKGHGVKYPHEECRKAVKRVMHNASKIRRTQFEIQFASINQNEIFLGNKKQIDKRLCMRCRKKFPSEGIWNRICNRCHSKIDRISSVYEPHKVYV